MGENKHQGGFLDAFSVEDEGLKEPALNLGSDRDDETGPGADGVESKDTSPAVGGFEPTEMDIGRHVVLRVGLSRNALTVGATCSLVIVILSFFAGLVVGWLFSDGRSRRAPVAAQNAGAVEASKDSGRVERITPKPSVDEASPSTMTSEDAGQSGDAVYSVRVAAFSVGKAEFAEKAKRTLELTGRPVETEHKGSYVYVYVGRYYDEDRSRVVASEITALDLDAEGQPDWPTAYSVRRTSGN